jgi:hypothetical protein
MSDSTLFKQIASTKLPESLYQQLAPYLDDLWGSYQERKATEWRDQNNERMKRLNREAELEWAFAAENAARWPAFVREHWPERANDADLVSKAGDGGLSF